MKSLLIILIILVINERSYGLASRRKGALSDFYKESLGSDDDWHGKWFPHRPHPNNHNDIEPHRQAAYESNRLDLDANNNAALNDDDDDDDVSDNATELGFNQYCDGQSHLLKIDFDPDDKRHSFNHLCLSSNRSEFSPDLQREAILVEHFIPPVYKAPIVCLNESIEYLEKPPPFGPFRPFAPQYGSYKYLPPQRWLHSLAEGGIVMLYHPCAFPGQVKELEKIVKNCLYRHIITPSQDLTADHPLALLAWGKYLKLSVVDEGMVVKFIKKNAKQGIIKENPSYTNSKASLYTAGLVEEAHLITDINDIELCGYKEM